MSKDCDNRDGFLLGGAFGPNAGLAGALILLVILGFWLVKVAIRLLIWLVAGAVRLVTLGFKHSSRKGKLL